VNSTGKDLYLAEEERLRPLPAHKVTLFKNMLDPDSLGPISVLRKDKSVYKVITIPDQGAAFVYNDHAYIIIID